MFLRVPLDFASRLFFYISLFFPSKVYPAFSGLCLVLVRGHCSVPVTFVFCGEPLRVSLSDSLYTFRKPLFAPVSLRFSARRPYLQEVLLSSLRSFFVHCECCFPFFFFFFSLLFFYFLGVFSCFFLICFHLLVGFLCVSCFFPSASLQTSEAFFAHVTLY